MRPTKQQKILCSLFHGSIRNYYTGTGRYTRKSADYVEKARVILDSCGLKCPRHYHYGNDAPRGGWSGDYLKLTTSGKRLKIVKTAVEVVQTYEQKKETKRKAINLDKYKARLPQVCHERIYGDNSKNHRKQLNAEIRFLADELDLTIPEHGLLDFARQQTETHP